MTSHLVLRNVDKNDILVFYEQQLDPDAQYMAAFTAKDPPDWYAFTTHWERILADPDVVVKTIVAGSQVAGHVLSYVESDKPEVTYWLGKQYWGRGLATQALVEFLENVNTTRPMYARAAKDNVGSLKVLARCGFAIIGENKGFANARGMEVEEYLLKLG